MHVLLAGQLACVLAAMAVVYVNWSHPSPIQLSTEEQNILVTQVYSPSPLPTDALYHNILAFKTKFWLPTLIYNAHSDYWAN